MLPTLPPDFSRICPRRCALSEFLSLFFVFSVLSVSSVVNILRPCLAVSVLFAAPLLPLWQSLCLSLLHLLNLKLRTYYLELGSPHSPPKCCTNLPNGRQYASTFPRSSAVKSGPQVSLLVPFRLICITPTTFPSYNIGALMILWIDSPDVVAVRTPSNTVACRTPEKLLLISGRLSRTVRAASAELLVSGMNPTFFSGCGTRKCKCRHLVDTARIATSSVFTPNSFAIFAPTSSSEFSTVAPSWPSAAAICSSSLKRLDAIVFLFLSPSGFRGAGPCLGESPFPLSPCSPFPLLLATNFPVVCALQIDSPACITFLSYLYCLSRAPFAPCVSRSFHLSGILRRRGHVFHGHPTG